MPRRDGLEEDPDQPEEAERHRGERRASSAMMKAVRRLWYIAMQSVVALMCGLLRSNT